MGLGTVSHTLSHTLSHSLSHSLSHTLSHTLTAHLLQQAQRELLGEGLPSEEAVHRASWEQRHGSIREQQVMMAT